MATEEEKRVFGIHKKYGSTPSCNIPPKKKPCWGRLLYKGELIYVNSWPLCQVEKKRLISQGYNPTSFKLVYDTN